MFKKLLIRLLLGRAEVYGNIVSIRGKKYRVGIYEYVSVDEMCRRAISSGVLTAQGEFAAEVNS